MSVNVYMFNNSDLTKCIAVIFYAIMFHFIMYYKHILLKESVMKLPHYYFCYLNLFILQIILRGCVIPSLLF
jgi:hypothetical protein